MDWFFWCVSVFFLTNYFMSEWQDDNLSKNVCVAPDLSYKRLCHQVLHIGWD